MQDGTFSYKAKKLSNTQQGLRQFSIGKREGFLGKLKWAKEKNNELFEEHKKPKIFPGANKEESGLFGIIKGDKKGKKYLEIN